MRQDNPWTKLMCKDQLEFKRTVILKAFQRQFIPNSRAIPDIDATHPSPLVYGYRTKITPHFEIPRSRSKDAEGQYPQEIGFVEKGRRRILDIEGVFYFVSGTSLHDRVCHCNRPIKRWSDPTKSPRETEVIQERGNYSSTRGSVKNRS